MVGATYGIVISGKRAGILLRPAFAVLIMLLPDIPSFTPGKTCSLTGDGTDLLGDKFMVAPLSVFIPSGHGHVRGGKRIHGMARAERTSLVLLLEILP